MGHLPVTSIKGCKYIMVLHNCYSNAILEKPLKSCVDSDLLQSLTALFKNAKDRGIQPRLHTLDNKCSAGILIFHALDKIPSSTGTIRSALYHNYKTVNTDIETIFDCWNIKLQPKRFLAFMVPPHRTGSGHHQLPLYVQIKSPHIDQGFH